MSAHLVAAALNKMLGTVTLQQGSNPVHDEFVRIYPQLVDDLKKFSSEEMRAVAGVGDTGYDVVAAFLKHVKAGIDLTRSNRKDAAYMAALLSIASGWAGRAYEHRGAYKVYNGVAVETGDGAVTYYRSPEGSVVVSLLAANGDRVWIYNTDEVPQNEHGIMFGHGLLEEISGWEKVQYPGVVFPQVRVKMRPDMSWLINSRFKLDDVPYVIIEALAKIEFDLDCSGLKLKVVFAAGGVPESMYFDPETDGYFVLREDMSLTGMITRDRCVHPYAGIIATPADGFAKK
jgi:hypothetical protein